MTAISLDPALIEKLIADRHWLHQHPELGYEEYETAAYVKARLEALGIPYEDGIAGTGIVARIEGRGDGGKAIGLRADMDALPITEENSFGHKSKTPGKMHACGHDGHTTMLLGAAEVLQASRDFDGTVFLIFQPAEENGRNGAEKMLAEGLLERFPMDAVYGLHNWPDLPVGTVGVLNGPVMASGSLLDITLTGQGGHGSAPQDATSLTTALAHVVLGINGLLANARDPRHRIVATLPFLQGGDALNVLPEKVRLAGSVRCLDQTAQDRFGRDVKQVAEGIAAGFGARAEVIYREVVPITTNAPAPAALVRTAVTDAGLTLTTEEDGLQPVMAGEDFSIILRDCPGCYFLLGQGKGGEEEPLHSPRYEFNDDVIEHGLAMFDAIVRRALPLTN
jgi:hippurate hydrolase